MILYTRVEANLELTLMHVCLFGNFGGSQGVRVEMNWRICKILRIKEFTLSL